MIMSISLNAQRSKNIEIINADNTYADHYTSKNKIQAFGRIKIKQGDSIIISGNYLTYFGSKNRADIQENVILIDKKMTLSTEKIVYNLISKIASYPDKGTIIDNEKNIYSKKGAYHSNLHKFIFKDSVKIIGKDYEILTDNMHYNSKYETAYFFGPSFIHYNKKTIYCENGWYNTKTDIAQFRENAFITTQKYFAKSS